MRRLALFSALALAGSACGKSTPDTPPPADTAPAAPDTAKPEPKSPLAEHAKTLMTPLASPEAIDELQQAADALTAWAAANPDAADATAARLAAARAHLLVAVGGPLEQIQERTADAQGELDALVKAGAKAEGVDPAELATAAAAVASLFPDTAFVPAPDALALAGGTGDAADVVRATWTAAATSAVEGLRAPTEAAPENRFQGGVGRMLCADCAEAATLASDAVVPFLLDGGHGAGLVCEAAGTGAAGASDAAARAKLLMGCSELGLVDAELAAGFGDNPLHVALLARAAALAAMPAGEGALAPVIEVRKAALARLLAAPYPLPTPALTAPLPEGDRPAEATLPAPITGLADDGLAVAAPAMSIFVVAPDGVRAGVRPSIGVKDGALVSLSKAAAALQPDVTVPDLDGAPVLTNDALLEAELLEETGGVAELVTAATLVTKAAASVIPDGDGPRAAELVVDALAPTAAVVRTLDSARAAGFDAFRFTRTAGSGAVPLVVRAAPEPLPAAAAPGFARPIIVEVDTDGVNVWAPDDAADPAPEGDADAALPEGAETGYRGKALVRLRVPAGEDDARGLSTDTVAKVVDAIAYWRKASGAGPLVHVAGADDARAADVLRVADAFQHAEGPALDDAEQIWPGATCPSAAAGGAPIHCPSGLAVAFSAISVPSSRGITPKPAERAPKVVEPAEPPPSPEFCNTGDIKSKMAREKHSFRFCYESQLRVISDLQGKLPVTFTIDLDGSVKNVRVGAATLKNERVKSCIVKAIGRMKFAKPDGGRCLVRWPFVFQPK